MNIQDVVVLSMIGALASACDPSPESTSPVASRRATLVEQVLQAEPSAGQAEAIGHIASELEPSAAAPGCFAVGGLVATTVAPHLHDPALLQQVGPMILVSLDPYHPFPGVWFSKGSILATITALNELGEASVNHHFALSRGTIRTQDDDIALTPTADPCVFDLDGVLNVVDGTESFAGVTGTGVAQGTSDVCTGRGQIAWQAELCP
ncbi:MAG: hypothetical protein K0V04_38390 [Deltaproteobacteria bacterium]|nr:hypothetical protein [Deltaproteobacteria bacterium]